MDATTLMRLEKGERRATIEDMLAIAVALDVSPDALSLPPSDEMPVALTERVVEEAGLVRRWWSGRVLLLGSLRRPDGPPSWPFPEEVREEAVARRRGNAWQSERPATEQRAYARDGVARLVRDVQDLVEAAGRSPEPTATDRLAMRRLLESMRREIDRQLDPDGDLADRDALAKDAARELKEGLKAVAEHTARQED